MFNTRVIIKHDEPIQLPDCMYKMKNILAFEGPVHQGSGIKNQGNCTILDISQQKELSSEMALLQSHQEKILKQLEELQQDVLNLKRILKIPTEANIKKNTSSNVTVNVEKEDFINKKGKISDLVINVNISNPPYSLLILKKLWSKKLQLVIKSFLHSSVVDLPETTKNFVKHLDTEDPDNSKPYVYIRLIWKNIDEKLTLITSSPVVIQGEVNLLRYLSRMGPNEYNYELLSNTSDVDSVLDTCYLLSRSKTKTERAQLTQSLSARLGKAQWICGQNISIADVAASSTMKQVMLNDLNVGLSKWVNRCETVNA